MSKLSDLVLDWYSDQGRAFPWRGVTDPYAVWVSEIMLQQTRVDTVIPYYHRWMERFPDLQALAEASEQDVLSIWEGLGYYRRARNLHRAANIILKQYDGVIPNDLRSLQKLPGIGRYTAAAIASIAFAQDTAALDSNIRRVLARLFNVEQPADSSVGETALWSLAENHLPAGRAGDFNQALMDLGATICLPRKPVCPSCPVRTLCEARALGVQEERPVYKPKATVPHLVVTAAIICRSDRILLARRPPNGLLGGMWEFPGGKVEPGETLEAALKREIQEELDAGIDVSTQIGVFRHAYTHFRITLHAFLCGLSQGEPKPIEADELAWVAVPDLMNYPMGKVDRLIARKLVQADEAGECGLINPGE
ncbi:MAG: A/G-specific adenine glycosylase [Chloroflexota bacterium]